MGVSYSSEEDLSEKDKNLRFYMNEIKSKPWPGHRITEMLKWYGKYGKLENNHSYIQWLFPIPERSSFNSSAQPLQEHEAKAIRDDEIAQWRVLEAYKMMLDFYGMRLECVNSGQVARCKNWQARYEHLNRSVHNYRRITRILQSLGELGYERYQVPWVKFLMQESIMNRVLPNLNRGCMGYWIDAIKDVGEREQMHNIYRELLRKPRPGDTKQLRQAKSDDTEQHTQFKPDVTEQLRQSKPGDNIPDDVDEEKECKVDMCNNSADINVLDTDNEVSQACHDAHLTDSKTPDKPNAQTEEHYSETNNLQICDQSTDTASDLVDITVDVAEECGEDNTNGKQLRQAKSDDTEQHTQFKPDVTEQLRQSKPGDNIPDDVDEEKECKVDMCNNSADINVLDTDNEVSQACHDAHLTDSKTPDKPNAQTEEHYSETNNLQICDQSTDTASDLVDITVDVAEECGEDNANGKQEENSNFREINESVMEKALKGQSKATCNVSTVDGGESVTYCFTTQDARDIVFNPCSS